MPKVGNFSSGSTCTAFSWVRVSDDVGAAGAPDAGTSITVLEVGLNKKPAAAFAGGLPEPNVAVDVVNMVAAWYVGKGDAPNKVEDEATVEVAEATTPDVPVAATVGTVAAGKLTTGAELVLAAGVAVVPNKFEPNWAAVVAVVPNEFEPNWNPLFAPGANENAVVGGSEKSDDAVVPAVELPRGKNELRLDKDAVVADELAEGIEKEKAGATPVAGRPNWGNDAEAAGTLLCEELTMGANGDPEGAL